MSNTIINSGLAQELPLEKQQQISGGNYGFTPDFGYRRGFFGGYRRGFFGGYDRPFLRGFGHGHRFFRY